MLDLNLIKKLAKVSRIEISIQEQKQFMQELNEVLYAFESLQDFDEEIMISPRNESKLREDIVIASDCKVKDFCKVENNFIVGPKLK